MKLKNRWNKKATWSEMDRTGLQELNHGNSNTAIKKSRQIRKANKHGMDFCEEIALPFGS